MTKNDRKKKIKSLFFFKKENNCVGSFLYYQFNSMTLLKGKTKRHHDVRQSMNVEEIT